MQHEEKRSKATTSPAAHNPSSSGISKPAAQPFQIPGIEEPSPLQMNAGTDRQDIKPFQLKPNETGLPDNLKSGIEDLSGFSMDDIKVHYNSEKPAQLNAHAYALGTDIHIAPGQEQHLPHEAWHVVQQKQERVLPTMQMNGVYVNDDQHLEKEATAMGAKAVAQRVLVAQLETRLSKVVQFNGTGYQLEQLVRQWGAPSKTQVRVIATDYVGGSYQVEFTRNGTITEHQANAWVDAALRAAQRQQQQSSSEESSGESSSSEEEDQNQDQVAIIVVSADGLMTAGDSATPMGNGRYDVVVNGVHYQATRQNGRYILG